MQRCGLRSVGMLNECVFRKSLRLSPAERARLSRGEVRTNEYRPQPVAQLALPGPIRM